MEKLPAGILPEDRDIEIFGSKEKFGKCFFISEGKTKSFWELPLNILDDLREELLTDRKALEGLRLMGITDEKQMLETYNYCNRGRLDGVPDIHNGKKTKEYVDCGRRFRCPGECKVCSPIRINGNKITFRELQCWRLIGNSLSYRQIMIEMGFRRETAVNSLMERLRIKLDAKDKTDLALKAKEIGIV